MVQLTFLMGCIALGGLACAAFFVVIGLLCMIAAEKGTFGADQIKVMLQVGATFGLFAGMGAGLYYMVMIGRAAQAAVGVLA